MNGIHWHGSVENVILYGVSALIVINVIRLVAVPLENRGGKLAQFGRAMSALT